jgi:hypothetical protein
MDDSIEREPVFEEIQEPPWPFAALGLGAGVLGAVAVTRALGIIARLGVAGLIVGGAGLVLREFLFPMTTWVFAGENPEIEVRFGRRTRFRVPLKNVVRAYERKYQPIPEYGGWGIRWGRDGRAFNMKGDEGVQLVLQSGQRLLIGSQRADQLAAVVQKLTGCQGEEA